MRDAVSFANASPRTKMAKPIWGVEDPLHRGDIASAVTLPAPDGNESVVRHILQEDDRRSPYLSATEDFSTAKRFAGKRGDVWQTLVDRIESAELLWISRSELMEMLRAGKDGRAVWPRRSDLLTAQQYVEEQAEHLIDFRPLKGQPVEVVRAVVTKLFLKELP
jgi:hypothetical protein